MTNGDPVDFRNHLDLKRSSSSDCTRSMNCGVGTMRSVRFSLFVVPLLVVAHWEMREMPVYSLVVATPGKLGPKLKPHAGDCDRAREGGPPPPGAPPMNCGTRTNMTPTAGKVSGSGITMQTFARNLAGGTGRNIVDKTGLAGSYDLELEFTPDQSPDTTGPSLFTAMQEQLGLKLDSQRAPVEVLVIDRLERPTPD